MFGGKYQFLPSHLIESFVRIVDLKVLTLQQLIIYAFKAGFPKLLFQISPFREFKKAIAS